MEYRLYHNPLKMAFNMGLKITWKYIYIGLYGTDNFSKQIKKEDYIEYLYYLLENEQNIDLIISLICAKDNDSETESLLRKLSIEENTKEEIELRKWRACLLNNLLGNVNSNVIQGLLELIEFWTQMDMEKNCPHIFPTNDDSYFSVANYFTQDVFDILIEYNSNWLKNELEIIKSLENNNMI